MANETPNPEHVESRAKTELLGLRNCLMPSDDDVLRRATTLILLVGWLGWTFGLGMDLFTEGGAVLGGFSVYQLVSFIVLYILGRMHDLEVKRILGLAPGDLGDPDRRERETERRDRGGFSYGNDRRDDDK